MDFIIDHTTYHVHRVFVGSKNINDIISDRIRSEKSQELPLTRENPSAYNSSREDPCDRRHNEI